MSHHDLEPVRQAAMPACCPADELRSAERGDYSLLWARIINEAEPPYRERYAAVFEHLAVSAFETRVRTIMRYKTLRAAAINPKDCKTLLVEEFSISPNVAAHIVNGKGYAEERWEAIKRLQAEALP